MKHILFILLFIATSFSSTLAGVDTYVSGKKGSNITGTIKIEDPDYACAYTACLSKIEFVKTKFITKLWYEDVLRENRTNWSFTVDYDITYYTNISPSSSYTQSGKTLSIDYNTTANYKDIDYEVFLQPGEFIIKAEVTINSVTPVGLTTIPNDIRFDLELETEKIFPISEWQSSAQQNTSYVARNAIVKYRHIPAKNELELYWNFVEGAESYDVEWLFIDAGNITNFSSAGPYEYDFANATRINTSQNHYNLSLAYSKGLLIFRARPVSQHVRTWHNGKGSWNTLLDAGTLYSPFDYQVEDKKNGLVTPLTAFMFEGMDPTKNWQYSVTYAEEGKRKEVVQYYDGAMYNRQSVTISNSTDKAIIGQTLYDFVGRPAVNVMPTPLTSSGIHYYDNRGTTDVARNTSLTAGVSPIAAEILSKNNASTIYTLENFDKKNTSSPGALPVIETMNSMMSKGAANYYSSHNSESGINSDYIPNAQDRPFTRTIYSADGTNRVLRQSGVGTTHQIGQKDTRYFYATPGNQELDRLFGNEVGAVVNYKKNIVVDPNGQASTSYIDGKGRTIATGLMGHNDPSNLLAIDTRPSSKPTLTDSLHLFNKPIGDSVLSSTKVVFIQAPSTYTFYYEIDSSEFTDCFSGNCEYDLEVYILDEATGLKVDLINPSTNLSPITDKTIRETIVAPGKYNMDFSATLSIGTYQVVKKLNVNTNTADLLMFNYIEGQTCYDFVPPPLVTSCDSCELDCIDSYTSTDPLTQDLYFYDNNGDFVALFKYNPSSQEYTNYPSSPDSMITISKWDTFYDNFIETCIEACTDPEISNCEQQYEQLKADMSPGGQYFDNHPNLGGIGMDNWINNNPILTHSSVSGNTQSNWTDIRTNWDPTWGDFTVTEHPEFCLFQKHCCYNESPIITSNDSCENTFATDLSSDVSQYGEDVYCCEIENGNVLDLMSTDTSLNLQLAIDSIIRRDSADGCYYLPTDTTIFISNEGFEVRYPNFNDYKNSVFSDPVAAADSMCIVTCEQSVTQWLSDFKCMDTLTSIDSLNLVNELIAICSSSCTNNGVPNDSTSVGVPTSLAGSSATNFEQVIHSYRDKYRLDEGPCPTPKFPSENDCNCDNVLNFALSNTFSYQRYTLPLSFQDIYNSDTVALDSLINDLTGWGLNGDYKSAYTACMNNTAFNFNSLPDLLKCEPDSTISYIPLNEDSLCIAKINADNYASAKAYFDAFLLQKAKSWRANYLAHCLSNAKKTEKFYYSYELQEYHYTLYFYDQADNLIKTVPPEGVYQKSSPIFDATDFVSLVDVQAHRRNATNPFDYPKYAMWTNYKYNSLNQLIEQTTPDGGKSIFFYDKLGRLIASQNNEQENRDAYSYTIFDGLGRIKEVGELISSNQLTDEIARSKTGNTATDWKAWFAATYSSTPAWKRTQIVKTYYDNGIGTYSYAPQNNLRNRIAAVVYDNDGDGTYESASHYDYDINGNVKTLVQENTNLPAGHQFKQIDYEYDLVSGNVNQVNYQKGNLIEQFCHKYEYDADNRLTVAYTSKDGIVWEKESKNFYYAHGPLARTEIGDKQVQAQDYAYTIQGWLKTINSSTNESANDLGEDAKSGTLNHNFAQDAYGFSLHYFSGDYLATGAGANANVIAQSLNSNFDDDSKDLFNGNISKMIVGLTDHNQQKVEVVGNAYRYDQLNRIKLYKAYTNANNDNARTQNNFANVTASGAYNSSYVYDGNGNIESLNRNGGHSQHDMDDFAYIYDLTANYKEDNKLYQVTDNTTFSGNYSDDLDNQGAGNYGYDAIGRLTKDLAEGITNIKWNVANKITEITKSGQVISFNYDPMGNRISKTDDIPSRNLTTYYVRDAQGNVISTYSKKTVPPSGGMLGGEEYKMNDLHIYGSSRLGVKQMDEIIFASGSIPMPQATLFSNRMLGKKRYELSNHLGNVLEVVSDRKLISSTSNSSVDFYTSDVISYSDYYPFGMLMPNRYTGNSKYKYGMNGMEKDDEIKGQGNSYTTLFRQYDPRIGRWLSIDPVQHHEFSPYVAFDDNPIIVADPSGADGEDKVKPNKPTEHKIVKGETLTKIAKNYKVSIEDLVKWNNIEDKDKIYAGDNLIVSNPNSRKGMSYGEWTKSQGFSDGQSHEAEIQADGGPTKLVGDAQGKTNQQQIADTKEFGRMGRVAAETVRDVLLVELAFMGGSTLLWGPEAALATGGGTAVYRTTRTLYPARGAFSVTNAGPTLGEFGIPKYYTYGSGGSNVYVTPHAMKHLEELAGHGAGNPAYLRLIGQTHQKALNAAIRDIMGRGQIQYGKMYTSGGNRIMFSAPRNSVELPAVKHFSYGGG